MSFSSYAPDNQASPKLNGMIAYISKTKYDDDWLSLPHQHNFTEIILVTDGQGVFVNNEVFYPVKKGDLVVVPSGNMHTEKSCVADKLSYYAIGIKNYTFHIDKFVFALEENYQDIFNLFNCCFNEFQNKRQDYDDIAAMILSSLFLLFQRAVQATLKETKNYGNSIIDTLIDYIDQNYNSDLTLTKMCALTYISKPHLIRLFKEKTSLTPMQYLKNKRLSAAKVLLTTTELKIIDIAMILNFSSESNFIAKFKSHIGVTPYKYKKSVK